MIKLTKKVLKGLISGTFNEGIRTPLVMFQVLQGIQGINPQVFSASTWERGHLFVFFQC